MRADVAIIIVTYNSARHIPGCLESVLAERVATTQHIIVVDNNSTDDTVAIIRAQFPQVQLLQPGRNLGFGAGVNFGAKHADATYLLMLNPDTVVRNRAIDRIVEFAQSHPGHGLYGGRTLKVDGSLEPSSCWGLPSLWSLLMFATGLSSVGRGNRWLDPTSLGRWPRDTVREVGFISGSFLLAEREVWGILKGFDERYFMYGEDADLGKRCRLAGYRPLLCPNAEVIHEVGQSSATPMHKFMLLYRGKVNFIRTHFRPLARQAGLALLLCGVGTRAFASRLAGVGRRTVRKEWPEVWARRREWLGRGEFRQSAGAVPQKSSL